MSQQNSQSLHIDDDSESEIQLIPQIQYDDNENPNDDRYKMSGQYMKVLKKKQTIDQQAILEEFNKSLSLLEERKKFKNLPKKKQNKKIIKITSSASKQYDFGYIKKKWKAKIDQSIESYKQYLTQQKKAYDGKRKEILLNLFRVLIQGIFQLRDYGQSQGNDLTNNERKIIAEQADICKWVTTLVDNFDRQFREAEASNKIQSAKKKWDALIKNCRDQNNFQLRRKIIRCKVKPIHVIVNNDEFLMSQQAKYEEQRRMRLTLAEAQKNFKKPLEQSNNQSISEEINQEIPYQQLQNVRAYSSTQNLDRRISQQRQKLDEYRQAVGPETANRLRKRIKDLLEETQCYERIMTDFEIKFQGQ